MRSAEKIGYMTNLPFAASAKPFLVIMRMVGAEKWVSAFEVGPRYGQAFEYLRKNPDDLAGAFRLASFAQGAYAEHSQSPSGTAMARAIPFLNPGVQSQLSLFYAAADADPRVQREFALRMIEIIGMGFLIGGVLKRIAETDEEWDEGKERSAVDQAHALDFKGLRWTYPPGPAGVLVAMGAEMGQVVMDDPKFRKGDKDIPLFSQGTPLVRQDYLLRSAMKSMSGIIDPSSWVFPPIQSFIENRTAYDFFWQTHIHSPWAMTGDPTLRDRVSTPGVYVALGRQLGADPVLMRRVVQQAAGQYMDEFITIISRNRANEPVTGYEPRDYPFIGRLFLTDPVGFRSQTVRDVRDLSQRWKDVSAHLRSAEQRGSEEAHALLTFMQWVHEMYNTISMEIRKPETAEGVSDAWKARELFRKSPASWGRELPMTINVMGKQSAFRHLLGRAWTSPPTAEGEPGGTLWDSALAAGVPEAMLWDAYHMALLVAGDNVLRQLSEARNDMAARRPKTDDGPDVAQEYRAQVRDMGREMNRVAQAIMAGNPDGLYLGAEALKYAREINTAYASERIVKKPAERVRRYMHPDTQAIHEGRRPEGVRPPTPADADLIPAGGGEGRPLY